MIVAHDAGTRNDRATDNLDTETMSQSSVRTFHCEPSMSLVHNIKMSHQYGLRPPRTSTVQSDKSSLSQGQSSSAGSNHPREPQKSTSASPSHLDGRESTRRRTPNLSATVVCGSNPTHATYSNRGTPSDLHPHGLLSRDASAQQFSVQDFPHVVPSHNSSDKPSSVPTLREIVESMPESNLSIPSRRRKLAVSPTMRKSPVQTFQDVNSNTTVMPSNHTSGCPVSEIPQSIATPEHTDACLGDTIPSNYFQASGTQSTSLPISYIPAEPNYPPLSYLPIAMDGTFPAINAPPPDACEMGERSMTLTAGSHFVYEDRDTMYPFPFNIPCIPLAQNGLSPSAPRFPPSPPFTNAASLPLNAAPHIPDMSVDSSAFHGSRTLETPYPHDMQPIVAHHTHTDISSNPLYPVLELSATSSTPQEWAPSDVNQYIQPPSYNHSAFNANIFLPRRHESLRASHSTLQPSSNIDTGSQIGSSGSLDYLTFSVEETSAAGLLSNQINFGLLPSWTSPQPYLYNNGQVQSVGDGDSTYVPHTDSQSSQFS